MPEDLQRWAERKMADRSGLVAIEVPVRTAGGKMSKAIRYKKASDAKKLIAEGKAKPVGGAPLGGKTSSVTSTFGGAPLGHTPGRGVGSWQQSAGARPGIVAARERLKVKTDQGPDTGWKNVNTPVGPQTTREWTDPQGHLVRVQTAPSYLAHVPPGHEHTWAVDGFRGNSASGVAPTEKAAQDLAWKAAQKLGLAGGGGGEKSFKKSPDAPNPDAPVKVSQEALGHIKTLKSRSQIDSYRNPTSTEGLHEMDHLDEVSKVLSKGGTPRENRKALSPDAARTLAVHLSRANSDLSYAPNDTDTKKEVGHLHEIIHAVGYHPALIHKLL